MSHTGNLKETNPKYGWGFQYPPTHHAFVQGSVRSRRACVDLEDKILYFHGVFSFPGCKVFWKLCCTGANGSLWPYCRHWPYFFALRVFFFLAYLTLVNILEEGIASQDLWLCTFTAYPDQSKIVYQDFPSPLTFLNDTFVSFKTLVFWLVRIKLSLASTWTKKLLDGRGSFLWADVTLLVTKALRNSKRLSCRLPGHSSGLDSNLLPNISQQDQERPKLIFLILKWNIHLSPI